MMTRVRNGRGIDLTIQEFINLIHRNAWGKSGSCQIVLHDYIEGEDYHIRENDIFFEDGQMFIGVNRSDRIE